MRKFYLFKLGFLTSTLCNCGLQEAEFQVQNENYGKNLTKSLKDLRTCLQNASYKNRQEQNAIKSNQTTLTGDIAELAKKFESRIKEKENQINTLQEQLIKQSEDLADLKKQKEELENLKTELEGKASQEALEGLKTKLTEKENAINTLQEQLTKQSEDLKNYQQQIKTELTNKIDQSKLDEEIQKHTKELIDKEKEINTLKTQLAQQSEALEDLKQQKDQIEKLENEFKAKGNDIEGLQQEIDDLKKQKEALENKLNEQIKNELKGKVDKTVLDAEIQKHTKELETKLIEKENAINKLQQDITDLKIQMFARHTETTQKLQKQNLQIKHIGAYYTKKKNKKNKQEFIDGLQSISEINIKSPRQETLTSKPKPGGKKPSDD